MNLRNSRVLVTGAAGGIGRAIVAKLAAQGAQVLAVDRDPRVLAIGSVGSATSGQVQPRVVDLASAEDRAALCAFARSWHGGINVLINNAGLNPFGMFEDLSPAQVDTALAVNLQAPMHLCRELLPHLRKQAPAAIVNMGSVFGSIGYPGYAAYAATKFAMRGFTEALRRELEGSGVDVKYLAPRATRTPINSTLVEDMNRELGVAMDPPERVAETLVTLLESGGHSAVVGWPEKLFVKINALLPGVVDRAIRNQLPIIQRYARASVAPATKAALLLAAVLSFGSLLPGRAQAQEVSPLTSELLVIQHDWEKANYDIRDEKAKREALEALSARADAFVHKYPGHAEPLVWEGIVLSTYAGAKGGLGALSLAKQSRDCLLAALKLDANALGGSAYTSLGALYYKVPGWPIGFGDKDKASDYLKKALALNPDGIDPNYFYGELLFEKGDYPQSMRYLQKALAAPARPDRPLADAGRKGEINALMARVRAKQG